MTPLEIIVLITEIKMEPDTHKYGGFVCLPVIF